MSMRKNTSVLWRYFNKDNASMKATCNMCKDTLSYKSTSANLKSHLRRKHPSVFVSVYETDDDDPLMDQSDDLQDQANESNSQSDYKTEQQSTEEVQYEIKSIKPRCIEIKPKRKKEFHSQEFVQHNTQIDEREFEAIGANVACKLKRMTPDQRCLAELLINKVLMCGLKDNLTDDTDLTEVYKT